MQIVFVREANRIPIRDITLSSDNERRKSNRIYFNMHFSRQRCHRRLFVMSVGSVVYVKDRSDSWFYYDFVSQRRSKHDVYHAVGHHRRDQEEEREEKRQRERQRGDERRRSGRNARLVPLTLSKSKQFLLHRW
jgi:hypothetical protein